MILEEYFARRPALFVVGAVILALSACQTGTVQQPIFSYDASIEAPLDHHVNHSVAQTRTATSTGPFLIRDMQGGTELALVVYDRVIFFSEPDWKLTDNPENHSVIWHERNGPEFKFVMIPNHENLENWTQFLTITTWKGRLSSAFKYNQRHLETLISLCGEDSVEYKAQTIGQDGAVSTRICGAVKNSSFDLEHANEFGRSEVIWTGKVRDTIISITREWRGPVFDVTDRAQWRPSEADITETEINFIRIEKKWLSELEGYRRDAVQSFVQEQIASSSASSN